MGEINHAHMWGEVGDDALYDADELVASAIVRKKGNGVVARGIHDVVTLRTRRRKPCSRR